MSTSVARLRLASLLLVTFAGAAEAKDACEPSPLFGPFPTAEVEKCEKAKFAALDLQRWKDLENRRGGVERFKMEGETWSFLERLPKGPDGRKPGKLEVRRNFETAVTAAKGSILYVEEGGGRVFFKLVRDDGEWWGEVGCGGSTGDQCNTVLQRMVRVTPMEQSVVVKADQIASAMADEGKVAFYGIYFDTDKAVLKPESAPSLVEMARWLQDNPAAKVFIVGHTDMVGAVPHNLQLSRDRAGAVVKALVEQHGVAASRLEAQGVGPLCPVRGNAGEAGRSKNRRVEMVLR